MSCESKNPASRRDFLKLGGLIGLGTAAAYALPAVPKLLAENKSDNKDKKIPEWRMLIDVSKCESGCDDCVTACHKENNVNPDLRWIRKATITKDLGDKKITVNAPLLCNQCDHPPCALVCPVEATFVRPDKVVDVDKHRCIGCRYCVIGCPYDVRVFNFTENPKGLSDEGVNPLHPKRMHGVAESCNFCAHRLDENKEPACVVSCKSGAMTFGNINDPDSKVSVALRDVKSIPKGLREDLGTKPKVLYLGL